MTGSPCLVCGSSLPEQVIGRPRVYCGDACRRASWNAARTPARNSQEPRKTPSPAEMDILPSPGIEPALGPDGRYAGGGAPALLPAHRSDCPGTSLERDELPDAYGRLVTRVRCVQCGAVAYSQPAPVADESDAAIGLRTGDEHWRERWHDQPGEIRRNLTPTERGDPRLNPQHPMAEAEPPGVTPQRYPWWKWNR